MNRIIVILIVMAYALSLYSFEIPFSEVKLQDESNKFSDFVRIQPDDKVKVPFATNTWLWHDYNNLYVYWECEIDDQFTAGSHQRRDNSDNADYVRFQIITNPDAYYSYAYWAYPSGILSDGIRNPDLSISMNWDSHYSYTSKIEDHKWIVEYTIPFEDMRYSGSAPYNWKINLQRMHFADDDIYNFPYTTTKMYKDYFVNSEPIVINHSIAFSKNYSIKPYFVQAKDLMNNQYSEIKDNLGIDLQYKPSSDLNLKFTANPDFSEVPMDAEQDNYNSKSPAYYNENRYFFTEDADFFKMNIYTRLINKPLYGIKGTSINKNFSFGLMHLQDQSVKHDSLIYNYDDKYTFAGLRYQDRYLFNHTTFAFRYNDDFASNVIYNYLKYEFMEKQFLTSEYEFTNTAERYSDNTQNGNKLFLKYEIDFNNFEYKIESTACDKNYHNEFYNYYENNFLSSNTNLNYNNNEGLSFCKELNGDIGLTRTVYFDTKQESYLGFYGNYWIKATNRFSHNLYFNINREEYLGEHYPTKELGFNISFFDNKTYSITPHCKYSHTLVYNLMKSYDRERYLLDMWVNIFKTIELSINYNYTNWAYNSSELDNCYSFISSDLTYNINDFLQIKSGLNMNDYKTSESTKDLYLGFYTNLKYDLSSNLKMYMGYQTQQNKIDDQYENISEGAYFKISAEI